MTAEPAPAPARARPRRRARAAPAARDAVPVVELRHITREFGSDPPVRALRDVDLTIERGESLAIVGAVRLGQVDAAEHPRLPRPADERART